MHHFIMTSAFTSFLSLLKSHPLNDLHNAGDNLFYFNLFQAGLKIKMEGFQAPRLPNSKC